MSNDIVVFIITLRDNKRFPFLKKRLNDLKISFKIIKAINGKLLTLKKLGKIYNKDLSIKNVGRELSPSEIGCAASHLKTYRYIVNNEIEQAIILEDDAYPSEYLKKWINNKVKIKNNEIINFYTNPHGFVLKKKDKSILNKKFNLHLAKTHLFGTTAYQINNYTCKKILKISKNKVSSFADWPFLFIKNKIKLFISLPFLVIINDRGHSYLKHERKFFLKENYLIKKIFPEKILSFLRIPYYFFYIPYFLGKYRNVNYYYEHFIRYYLIQIRLLIFKRYIDLSKIYYKEKFYCEDLKEIIKLRIYKNTII